MISRAHISVLALVLLLHAVIDAAAPSAALAERSEAERRLRDGIAAYNRVEYDQALAHLSAALRMGRRRELLARAYFYLGCTYLARDKRRPAREAFETLLSFRPSYLPDRQTTSPKIANFFTRVRRSYATPQGEPMLAHTPPERADKRLTRISAQTLHLSPRLRPVLRYRSAASPGYFLVEPTSRGRTSTFVMPTPRGARRLEYYFELVDRRGVVLGRLGSPRSPFRVRVGQRSRRRGAGVARRPWYKTWWFWTIAGVAVAAGVGVGVGIAVSGDDPRTTQVTILADGRPVF